MLYALELTRLHCHVNKEGGLTSDQFRKILKRGTNTRGARGPAASLPTMRGIADQLFRDCPGLPRGLSAYTVEQHIPQIQETYDRLYPGKYRIIVFDQFGSYVPCYKGPQRAEYDVCIVHHGSEADGTAHFDGVRCVNTLFGKSFYCPECQLAFGNRMDHTAKCVQKCRGCGGFGAQFPCRGGLSIECSDCDTKFVSRECYERHLGMQCDTFKTCKDCGVKYHAKQVVRLSKEKKHVCTHKFCGHCCTFHKADQPCYIQKVNPKNDEKPCRFLAYDFECSQHTRPYQDKEWFLHEVIRDENALVLHNIFFVQVNFVCAMVTCTECIAQNTWKDLTRTDCKVCGPQKRKTWSEAEGQSPLSEFVKWILQDLNKNYTTYAFAHYGNVVGLPTNVPVTLQVVAMIFSWL